MATRRRVRLGLGYVPLDCDVFPRLTVEDTLIGGRSLGGRRADLSAAYANVAVLGERRRQPAGTLSGGQQQLAIGRVLVGNPSCCCSTSLRKASSSRSCRTSPG